MLKNYFKIAWRNMLRSPFYSMVNIAGLSTGIAFTLLIAAYVWNEWQVNASLDKAERQYIIQSRWTDPNQGYPLATLGPLAKALKENYPNLVENYYRFDGITTIVSRGAASFREGLQVGDSTFLGMYGFKLEEGNAATAFAAPASVVITREAAKKYFGNQSAVGQTVMIESFSGSKQDFLVTGVLAPIGRNSITNLVDDYPNHFFVSDKNLAFFGRNMDWNNPYIASYVQLKSGVSAADLEKPIRDLVKTHASPAVAAMLTPYATGLKDYYLSANDGLVRKMIYALSAIAVFILGMAIINFVNMSVSRSATRMREIGVRKVLGSLRKQLIGQFLVESIVLVFVATIIAFCLYLLTMDLFGTIIGKKLPSLNQFPVYYVVFPFLVILITGTIAGIYPAFVLSAIRSVDSLKGKLAGVKENVLLRKGLVAFQFATATIVFAGAVIISRQISLFFSKDLGYDKEFVLAGQVSRNWSREGVLKIEGIRQQLEAMPEVTSAAVSYEVPDGNNAGNFGLYRAGQDSTTAVTSQLLYTDEHYSKTYGIPMAAGKFFSEPGALADTLTAVINEAEVRALGWKDAEAAIGQQVRFPGASAVFTIAGVTKDFHFGSMQKAIQPTVFLHLGATPLYRYMSVKLKPGNIAASLQALQQKWNALMPATPFEYKFMDETLNKLYKSEIQLKKASLTATVLSFIIVLLGVIGLVSLAIQKRTREIGIRKVLGASVVSIVSLFLREFIGIVVVAALVACPVAWYLMDQWLNEYAYRINLDASPFLLSVAGLAVITLTLIALQTLRAGNANPVDSLKTE